MSLNQSLQAKVDVIINGEKALSTMKDMENAARTLAQAYKLSDDVSQKEKVAAAFQKINEQIKEEREQLKGAANDATSFFDRIKEGAAEVFTGLGLFKIFETVIGSVKEFASESVKAFIGAEKAYVQLQEQMLVANKESEQSFKALIDQSEKLTGLFHEKDIRQAQLFFEQFGLGAANVQKLIPHLLDFAAATGQTLPEASSKLAAGINGNEKILKSYGLVVDKNAAAITNYGSLLDQLTVKYKGQEEVIANNTTAGALAKLSSAWEKLSEKVGNFFAPAINGLANFTTELLKMTEVPVSEKMEEERQSLLAVETQLYDVNLKHADRVKLIEKLKEEYPDYLKDIDAETVSNDTLSKSIKQINEQLINKIVIQTQEEAIQKQAKETADKRRAAYDGERAMLAAIAEARSKYGYVLQQNMTTEQQARAASEFLQKGFVDQTTNLNKAQGTISKLNNSWADYTTAIKQTQVEEQKGNKLIETKIDLMNRFGMKLDETTKENTASVKEQLDALNRMTDEELQAEVDKNNRFALDILTRRNQNKDKIATLTQKLYEELALLQASSIKDEEQRDLAGLKAKFDNKQKELEKEKLKKKDLTEDEIAVNAAVEKVLIVDREAYEREKTDMIKKWSDKRAKDLEKWNKEEAKAELDQDLVNLDEYFAQENLKLSEQRAQGFLTEKQYQTKRDELDLYYLALKIKNLQDYADHDKEAKKLLVAAQTAYADKIAKITTDKAKEEQENLDVLLKGATAKQRKLFEQYNQELLLIIATGISITGESAEEILKKIALLFKELHKPLDGGLDAWQISIKTWLDKNLKYIQQFSSSVQGIWSNLNKIKDNKSDAALAKEKANLDKEKAANQNLYDHKLLTQAQFDAKNAALDEKQAKAERKAAHDKAVRDRDAALFTAGIQAGQAIITTLASTPWPFDLILAAAEGAYLATEIDAIESTPIPALGDGDYTSRILQGPSHSSRSKGMPVINPETGKPVMMLEGKEIVGSANFVEKNPEFAAAIVTASQKYDGDLTKVLPYYSADQPQMNYSRVNETAKMMGNGGYISQPSVTLPPKSGNGAWSPATTSQQPEMLEKYHAALVQNNATMDKLNKKLDDGIEAHFVYTKFKRDVARLDAIQGNKKQ